MKRLIKSGVVELVLSTVGIGLVMVFATASLRAFATRLQSRQFVQSVPVSVRHNESEQEFPVGTLDGTYLAKAHDSAPAHVVGRLTVSALGLDVTILSGIDSSDLTRGIGHVPGSADAGGLGNMAVAGHRDTFFRPLRHVAPGMIAVVTSSEGSFRYQVDKTLIVSPEELRVLEIGDYPQLTMITCYPFDFIGAAPKRFIVVARLLSAAPDSRP